MKHFFGLTSVLILVAMASLASLNSHPAVAQNNSWMYQQQRQQLQLQQQRDMMRRQMEQQRLRQQQMREQQQRQREMATRQREIREQQRIQRERQQQLRAEREKQRIQRAQQQSVRQERERQTQQRQQQSQRQAAQGVQRQSTLNAAQRQAIRDRLQKTQRDMRLKEAKRRARQAFEKRSLRLPFNAHSFGHVPARGLDGYFAARALEFAKTVRGPKTVLGKIPQYGNVAGFSGAAQFVMSPQRWDALSASERWRLNRRFIDEQISKGARVILASPSERARGHFGLELAYLKSKGYTLSNNGYEMVRK